MYTQNKVCKNTYNATRPVRYICMYICIHAHIYTHVCLHTCNAYIRIRINNQWCECEHFHKHVITYLLLLISMLWHRQAIFESKGDKLSSSAESRIQTQGDTSRDIVVFQDICAISEMYAFAPGLSYVECISMYVHICTYLPMRVHKHKYMTIYTPLTKNCYPWKKLKRLFYLHPLITAHPLLWREW